MSSQYNNNNNNNNNNTMVRAVVLTVVVMVAVTLEMTLAQTTSIEAVVGGATSLRQLSDQQVKVLLEESDFIPRLVVCSHISNRNSASCTSNPILAETLRHLPEIVRQGIKGCFQCTADQARRLQEAITAVSQQNIQAYNTILNNFTQ
ncbi:hypothetical protein Pmani_025103 [Petrolisthes manimaculis]|uniref:Uncharacterized protein n=1 Tax=Petrolisthes manimaculis TaxID=1843537 RepID=A0AAE1P6U9_9EUCA|nr:hypothetical protein Pmani_025103 [Petrolisthes manimaculis]